MPKTTEKAIACLCCFLPGLVAVADDWPQWRGPNRDGISREKGLLQSWPKEGPPLVRTITDVGGGSSSPFIAKGRILLTGHSEGQERVHCFALDGKRLWSAKYDSGRGAQGSAMVDGDTVYAVSRAGRLAAFAFDSGEGLWQRSFKEFGGRLPTYRYAETVLISGDKLICQPGGREASVVALDKRTGKTIWKSSGMNDTVTYCSGIVAEIRGVRQIVVVTEVGLVGLDEKTGNLLWRFDAGFTGARNCLTPVVWKDHVFAESGHKGAGAIVKVSKEGGRLSAAEVWRSPGLPSHLGGHVGMDGKVYGHNGKGWGCRDMLTGEEAYRTSAIENCSTIHADARFYCLSNQGTMYLIEADKAACRIVSRFDIPNAGSRTWARPAIADGLLYLRREDSVFVYDVRASRGQPAPPAIGRGVRQESSVAILPML